MIGEVAREGMGAHLEAEQVVTKVAAVARRTLRPTMGRMNLALKQTPTRKVLTKTRRMQRTLGRTEKQSACQGASSLLLLTWTPWRTVTSPLRSSLLTPQEIDRVAALETSRCLLHPDL